jgi:hypothetical protein
MEERKAQIPVDKALRIPCSLSTDFFEKWFQILKPVHHLSNAELKLLAEFCRVRYEYSKKISDPETLDKFLFSAETKNMIRENLNMPSSSFQVSMSKLKKANMIVNGKIDQRLLPKLQAENTTGYKLLLYFDLHEKL